MEIRRWDRLVMAEVIRHPHLSQSLYKAGPQRVLSMICDYIELQTRAGRLEVEDFESAAEHLLGLTLGLELVRAQMASQPARSEEYLLQRAKSVAWAFLKIYGVEPRNAS